MRERKERERENGEPETVAFSSLFVPLHWKPSRRPKEKIAFSISCPPVLLYIGKGERREKSVLSVTGVELTGECKYATYFYERRIVLRSGLSDLFRDAEASDRAGPTKFQSGPPTNLCL